MTSRIISESPSPSMDSETAARLAKFKRRAPKFATQAHLDKAIASFPEEHRPLVISEISAMLPQKLVAREDVVIEVKPQIEGQPNPTEETVMRLNSHAAKVVEQAKTIESLQAELDSARATIKMLTDTGLKE